MEPWQIEASGKEPTVKAQLSLAPVVGAVALSGSF